MKIKVDEDLPASLAELLRNAGHDVDTVSDEDLSGAKDPDLWKIVQSEKRFFVTADKGFGDIRRHPPRTHEGILLLRPAEDGIPPVLSLIQQVLDQMSLENLRGTIAVVTPSGIRIRRK